MSIRQLHGLIACLAMISATVGIAGASPSTRANQILAATGVRGGLVVHLGCGDGKLTAQLRTDNGYVVHGLDADASNVAKARAHIESLNLYGPVSVEHFTGAVLPYASNLINLVVAEDLGRVPMAEVMRVLVPNGIAYVNRGGGFAKTVKPRPGNIDEWGHFLHDAGNNAVARDEVVAPPRSLQWVAPPLWLRSHETPSGIEGVVLSGGRLFYFFDEGLIGITDERLPERWSLVCRDAFNGKLLWKRPLDKWGWPEWARQRFAGKDWTATRAARTVVPNENQRRLVADGERLYATLSYQAPLSILDAATGKTLTTVEEASPVREMVVADGVAVVYAAGAASPAARRGEDEAKVSALVAVHGTTGKALWRKDVAPIKSLFLAVDQSRVICQSGANLMGFDLRTGNRLWQVQPNEKKGRTLVAHGGVVAILSAKALEARDGATGNLLWHKQVPLAKGMGSEDLFVANGLLWPAMMSVDENDKVQGKSADALAVGYDLRTGEERKRVRVANLRSPEHHHRCYRNKATDRFLISAMEGAEFLDIQGDGHSQDNWIRGACRYGVVPANGLLYAPPDPCFCEPGSKLLGFTAVAGETTTTETPDGERLQKGPAYSLVSKLKSQVWHPGAEDWPTYRADAGRHGSVDTAVPANAQWKWTASLGNRLTQPVAAKGRVYVAAIDAHTVFAFDADTGERLWHFTAGGRIDSPPTIYRGLVLFGSADGRVYCLRAADGALAWSFLAAPTDRRIASFDQLESVWPVHGSVLVRDGSGESTQPVAYFSAGRSTYLDGGIRLYGLDPFTGAVLHKGLLEGPFPDRENERDVSFYVLGANSDVLVSEGDALFMRQKRLTPTLQEIRAPVLSTKGEQDVGLHVFSTSGLLDGSWYNRTFWMYSKRWPGFQLANQAPKTGQLLVVDEESTYAVRVFYRRNVHSPMFFPGKEGYLLFADSNTTEPQIVGEEGARKPLEWLPQSRYVRRGDQYRELDSDAFGLDKMIGYTRADPPLWTTWLPVRIRAMVKAGDTLFVAGPPDEFDPKDPYAAFEGRRGARLVAVSAADGKELAQRKLQSIPAFDGMIAARGKLYLSTRDGKVVCLG